MRIKNTLAIIIFFLFVALIPFIWPATDIKVLGHHIDWDGLNLSTISGHRYEGELRFRDALDTRGGVKYTFESDLATFPEDERQKTAEELVYKFADRLERNGYKDFDMRWWINDGTKVISTVLVANQAEDDAVLISLLASRGNFSFWTQDPEYSPEEENTEFNFYQGMKPADITQGDILSLKSVYGVKNNGYGFKLKFKNESAFNILSFTQTETYRTTMMVIDGQPVAVRSYQLETTGDVSSYEPVVHMTSLIDNSFDINDTVEVMWQTGELPASLELTDSQPISPLLGESFENNIKLAIFIAVCLLSILLIFRYRFLGIFVVLTYFLFSILLIFVLMLFRAQFSLPLIFGIFLGFLLFLLLQIDLLSRLKRYPLQDIEAVYSDVDKIQSSYRRLLIVLLGLALVISHVPIFEVAQTANVLGVGIIATLIISYLAHYLYLVPFYSWQLRYETNKKS